jgi:membrane-associated PAP2 superfamily phosphatase
MELKNATYFCMIRTKWFFLATSNTDLMMPGQKGDSNSWWNNDFPSGHTVGTFCLFALFFYIVANDDKKINKKTVIFFWTILAHITILQISLLIYRFHWLTDLNFSTMFCIPCFWLVNWLEREKKIMRSLFTKKINGRSIWLIRTTNN